ncbi:MAG: LemA family protein [Phycisphaerae bacterium]|nr:LemA family protein [Phycisphaerae bacterium]
MNLSKIILVFLAVVVLVGLIAGGCALSGYNRAIALDEGVKNAWAQVENQLQRRYDLIPNAVEAVKGYAKHEKELFEKIASTRQAYFQPSATAAEKIRAANAMEGLLSRLLVLRETYPELKANEGFLKFQDQLEGTENRLSVERKRYNDAVRDLNGYIRGMPGRFFAGLAGVSAAEYFESAEGAKDTPKVSF